jgi:hypothetical protein
MKIDFKILKTKKETAEGFMVVLEVAHQNKRKQKTICHCHLDHWDKKRKLIDPDHPDFDLLLPIIMDLKIKAKKMILQGVVDVEKAFVELFKEEAGAVLFNDYAAQLISEMKTLANGYGKNKDLKSQNKVLGNLRVYENVNKQFENFVRNVALDGLEYKNLMAFRNYQLGIGNSKSTVHLYLRTVRSIYNKGVLHHKLFNSKPFEGVFANLKQRSFDNKKKYLDKKQIEILEKLDLKSQKQKYVDLFLLQFYFGGCDLIDLYYLKNAQLRRGRVIFERTKTNTGNRIDLKIHLKAQVLIDKYKCDGEWLFGWAKEKAAYETFRRTFQRGLIYVQEKIEMELRPDGGNIGAKVARHTFANIAKNLMIETDVIRELMGHERDDVDNYYKDKYPEVIRDKALFDIIAGLPILIGGGNDGE